jgi:Ca2+-binding RTX toxin-like protein
MSTVSASYADQIINGDASGDTISGGGGSDRIIGGAADDTLYGFGAQDTDPNSGAIQARLMPHVNNPVGMATAPGDANDLYFVNMAGEIDVLNTTTGQMNASPFLAIPSSQLGSGGERGLEAVVFDPNYQSNGQFYVSLATPNGDFQVWRYTRSAGNPAAADPNSGELILSVAHPNDSHYAGWMAFGPDGNLYVATGDNDMGPNPDNPAGDMGSLLGKILRIDVHRDDFPGDPGRNYGIPSDNPFVGVSGTAPEIFASGLRNPWRGSFDSAGNLYVADVGENAQEELDFIPAGSHGGQNFGWPTMEGNLGPGGGQFTAPILTYDHGQSQSQGDCIIGGYVYQGPGGADGLYIYGDFSLTNIWAADIQDGQVLSNVNLDRSIQTDVGSISLITSFGTDPQGRLYVATVFGAVYQLGFSAAAGDGSDVLSGGAGNDLIYGGAGDDQLYGGPGTDTLSGGLGNDVLDGGGQADILTGGAGADRFVISFLPTAAAIITDLALGADRLDLNALLAKAGYAGNDPVSDGWVTVASDGGDGSYVYFDPDGPGPQGGVLVADLQHIAPTSANLANALAIYTPRAAASTADSAYAVPSNITDVTLTGSAQTITGNDAGDTFFSNDTGNTLIGGGGQDVFHLGGGGDVATGGAGADIFLFEHLPATAAHITDFAPGEDLVDLSALLTSLGYSGADAAADGFLKVADDGAGNAQVWVNAGGAGAAANWALVATLDGVALGNVEAHGSLIEAASAPGAGGTTGGGGSTTGQTYTSDNNGDHWTGTAGDDVFNLGRGGDVVTGNGGADLFKFAETPWAGGHITDFSSDDVLDLSGLLARSGYAGADPIADGYIKIADDGAGDGQVWSFLGGQWWLATTLDHVAAGALQMQGDSVMMTGGTIGGGGSTAGQTYTSDNNGDHWVGTAGDDTFNLGRGGDVVTGNGGADLFRFVETPWAGGRITDFSSDDVLDLSGLLARSGYTGADPIADGYIKITDDGAGDGQVWSYLGGQWWLVASLDHVGAGALQMQGDTVVVTAGSTGGGGSATGQTYTSDNNGDHWIGTAADDTFNLGRGGDVVTGNGGADLFKFAETPWAGAEITDFSTADDRIDLTGLLQKSGYTGSDAIADGYLKIADDGAGDAQIWSNLDKVQAGLGWYVVATLDHVSAASLHLNGAFITG